MLLPSFFLSADRSVFVLNYNYHAIQSLTDTGQELSQVSRIVYHLDCAAELSLSEMLVNSGFEESICYCICQARHFLILGNVIFSFKFLKVENKCLTLAVLCHIISYISVYVKYCLPAFFTCSIQ